MLNCGSLLSCTLLNIFYKPHKVRINPAATDSQRNQQKCSRGINEFTATCFIATEIALLKKKKKFLEMQGFVREDLVLSDSPSEKQVHLTPRRCFWHRGETSLRSCSVPPNNFAFLKPAASPKATHE